MARVFHLRALCGVPSRQRDARVPQVRYAKTLVPVATMDAFMEQQSGTDEEYFFPLLEVPLHTAIPLHSVTSLEVPPHPTPTIHTHFTPQHKLQIVILSRARSARLPNPSLMPSCPPHRHPSPRSAATTTTPSRRRRRPRRTEPFW